MPATESQSVSQGLKRGGRRRREHGNLLRVEDLADRLDVSRATAYRIVSSGEIERTYVGTGKRKTVRISEAALTDYLNAKAEPARTRRS